MLLDVFLGVSWGVLAILLMFSWGFHEVFLGLSWVLLGIVLGFSQGISGFP